VLEDNPLSGALFAFCNRRGDKLKVLYYDGQGLCLWYKRLGVL
jgi:transposase